MSLSRPDGTVTTYAYDVEGQLLRLENLDAEGEPISWFSYEWDGEGNPVAEESLAAVAGGGQVRMSRRYAYDENDRLVSFEESAEGDGAPPSHTLETYEWDAAGNRTAIERTDLGTGALERTELAYDDDDRLVEAAGPEGRTTYSYDAAGNLVEKSAPGEDPVQYAWAAENRLAAVRQGGRVLMAATYDGDGNRVFQASLYRTNETAVGEEEFSWLEPKQVRLGAPEGPAEETVWTSPTRVAPRWTPAELTALLESGRRAAVRAEAPLAGWAGAPAASGGRSAGAPALWWALYGGAFGACAAPGRRVLRGRPGAVAGRAGYDVARGRGPPRVPGAQVRRRPGRRRARPLGAAPRHGALWPGAADGRRRGPEAAAREPQGARGGAAGA